MDVDTLPPCKPDLASRLESVFGRLGTSPSPAADNNNGAAAAWSLQESALGFRGGKAVDLEGYSSEEEAAPRPAVPPGGIHDDDDDEDDEGDEYEGGEGGKKRPHGARRRPSGSSGSSRGDADMEAEDADAGLLPRPCFGEDRRRDEQFLSSCSAAFRRAFEAEEEEDEYDRVAVGRGSGEGRGRRRSSAAGAAGGGGGGAADPLVAAAALLMQDAEEKPDGAMEVPDDNIFDRMTALRTPSSASEAPPPGDANRGTGRTGGASHEARPVVAVTAPVPFHDEVRAAAAPPAGTSSWAQRVMAEARASGHASGWVQLPASGLASVRVAMDEGGAAEPPSPAGAAMCHQEMALGEEEEAGSVSVKRSRCEAMAVGTTAAVQSLPDEQPPSSPGFPPCASGAEGGPITGSGSRLKKASGSAVSRRSSDGGGGGSEAGRRVRFEGVADDGGDDAKEPGRRGGGQLGGQRGGAGGSGGERGRDSGAGHGRGRGRIVPDCQKRGFVPDHVRNPASYTVYVLDEPLTVGGGGRAEGGSGGGGGRGGRGQGDRGRGETAAAAAEGSGIAAAAAALVDGTGSGAAAPVGSGATPADYLSTQFGAGGGAGAGGALAYGSGAVQFRRRKEPSFGTELLAAEGGDAASLRPPPRGGAARSLQPAAAIINAEEEDGVFGGGQAGTVAAAAAAATVGADAMEVDGSEPGSLGAPGGALGGGRGARVRQFRQRRPQQLEEEGGEAS